MKLSKYQQQIIDDMRNGWQLGMGMNIRGRCWLQKGGCGRGGETRVVRCDTVWKLWRAGIILHDKDKFPLRTYRLRKP